MLPMGCASARSIFEAFSTALEWVAMTKLGASKVVHVTDDFLFMTKSLEKCEFLGVTLDVVSMEARLPKDTLAPMPNVVAVISE